MTRSTDEQPISAAINYKLAPWPAPNFARPVGSADETAIPVAMLDDDALEDMALAWVRDLYRKAGRTHCPFRSLPKAAKP